MKKITLWLSMIALGLCLGCQGSMMDSIIQNKQEFKHGQMVNLKIGGVGQIIRVGNSGYGCIQCNSHYIVRIQGNNGPHELWFHDFELEIKP